jgi:hypothetical protein
MILTSSPNEKSSNSLRKLLTNTGFIVVLYDLR